MSADRLSRIDEVVTESIAKKECPGAVVLVGRHGKIVFRKAYGHRAVLPALEPMTLDTVFDLASLTKVVATATSVMALVEDGRVRLADRVAKLIPEFASGGGARDQVTVEQLLTHRAGLAADDPMALYIGYAERDLRKEIQAAARREPAGLAFPVFGRRIRGARRARRAASPLFHSTNSRVGASSSRSGMNETGVPSALGTSKRSRLSCLPHRADREDQRHRPTRRSPRPARLRARRRRGPRGALLDGGRSRPLLRGDARGRRRRSFARDGRRDDTPALLRRREPPRPRLGRGDELLVRPGRPLPARLVRAHGLDRHVAVAGSDDRHVRRSSSRTATIPTSRATSSRCAARSRRSSRRRSRTQGPDELRMASEKTALLAAVGADAGPKARRAFGAFFE